MNDQIKNISLKFTCEADWDAMDWVDGAKHCQHCQKKVYDFTGAKQDEFLMILAENNHNVCGRFGADQMAVKHPVLPWKKWVSAALILIGVNVFNQKAAAQNVKSKAIKSNKTTPAPELGEISVGGYSLAEKMPEFPGGEGAWAKFIESHFKKVAGTKGKKVIIGFAINKDGSLTDVKILRGINAQADREALRVIKLSPKWKPGMQDGKAVKVSYAIPVSFE